MEKLIITVAPTGSVTIPTQTPYLPITPEDIAKETVRAAEAGAAIVHIHARDPQDGKPTTDLEVFKDIITRIKERSDIIICLTTGGAPGMDVEERLAVVTAFKPELASFNMGSVCVRGAPIAERYKDEDYKYTWEKTYLVSLNDLIQRTTWTSLARYLQVMNENETKNECGVYDVSHIYNISYFNKKGMIKPPLWMNFVFGTSMSIGASPEEVIFMKSIADREFGAGSYQWGAICAGRAAQFRVATLAIMMGGHVRVGFEDNIFLEKGVLAKSNAELVEKIVKIAKDIGREIATPDEARNILKLKGGDKVNF